MKIPLLLSLFLCTALAGIAQQVDTIDSTFFSSDSGATYHLNSIYRQTHDAGCRNDSATYYYFNTNSQSPVLITAARTLYSYYANDSLREEIIQDYADSIPSPADSFVNVSRRLISYTANAAGSSRYDTDYVWKNNRWQLSGNSTASYNIAKQVTLTLWQVWDSTQRVYINRTRQISAYNAAGLQTVSSYQYWSGLAWMAADSNIYVYDANNYLVSDTLKNNGSGPILKAYKYTTYYNNSKGKPDSSADIFPGGGQETYKRYYSYYPDSTTQKQRYQYTYNTSNKVTYGQHDVYTYDTSGTTYTFTQTTEILDTATHSFKLLEVYALDSTYDAGGLLTQDGFSDYYYDGNGVQEYAETYETYHHYTPCTSALPVTLLSFAASKKDNNAVLQWKTANETNTASFAVQRSTDGVRFTTVGTVKAAGNSSGERTYTYTDYNINRLEVSKVYYRLAQQDINGAIHNSRIAQVDITGGRLSVTLSPNPVRNIISIYSPVAITNAVIRIAGISGKAVYTSRTNLAAGSTFTINASAFAGGMYFVTVQSGSDVQVMKLVKE